MTDFNNSILWNKKKLNKTYNYIKDNCTLKQITTQYLTFIYCQTNKEWKQYNVISVTDNKTNKRYKFTSFKNLVSYFYDYVL